MVRYLFIVAFTLCPKFSLKIPRQNLEGSSLILALIIWLSRSVGLTEIDYLKDSKTHGWVKFVKHTLSAMGGKQQRPVGHGRAWGVQRSQAWECSAELLGFSFTPLSSVRLGQLRLSGVAMALCGKQKSLSYNIFFSWSPWVSVILQPSPLAHGLLWASQDLPPPL